MRQTFGRREKLTMPVDDLDGGIRAARRMYGAARYCEAVDIYELLAAAFPEQSIAILAELYDCYQQMPDKSRYALYQQRIFDFGIKPGDKVLDIGSGHIPFPLATHLADLTLTDHQYGRAGTPFKHIDGKPVYECSVESMPFADKEFDFVYCSHVLEHTGDPVKACRELMRVGKRGYIETPARAKELFLNSAKLSNHTRYVELRNGRLVFTDYSSEELEGLQCDILQRMHSAPQTAREKAFAALIWLKADLVNTMLLWEDSFEFELADGEGDGDTASSVPDAVTGSNAALPEPSPALRFMQVHTFYERYLEDFYRRNPQLVEAGFAEQINGLVRDGFSGIHIFAPYMSALGYEPHLVVANNSRSQVRWLVEHGMYDIHESDDLMRAVVRRQIETIKPDILYLTDPITFDGHFIRSLSWKPRVVIGWRGANIPSGTDWTSFDLMLSSLVALRDVALQLGAGAAAHFFPGYPVWMNQLTEQIMPHYDVVFSGSWTPDQHPRRNQYIISLARAAADQSSGFSCGLYISCSGGELPPEVQRYNLGERFGVGMHAALRRGRIVIDARGVLEYRDAATGRVTDLADRQTANMRIFEVTGSGRFLLAEHYDNIGDYFEVGREIETFRDEQELFDKIRYYLAHPEQREEIARRGQERCLRLYSMEMRAAELDRIIRTHITALTSGGGVAPDTAVQLTARATAMLEQGEVRQAYELFARAKAAREPVQGLDLQRARCFELMGQPADAIEALREELRWFPGNRAAADMLEVVRGQNPVADVPVTGDDEFDRLLQVIRPYTMLSVERLHNLYRLGRYICEQGIPGNFVECGVAAGGSSALLAWVIKKYSRHPRKLFAFDTFSGMPQPTDHDRHFGTSAAATGWGAGTCAAPESSVLEVCTRLGVEGVLTTVKGDFQETLPRMRDWLGMIALLHMDGDWYESTRAILTNLYDRLVNNAVVQVDDYGYWEGCRTALHEFMAARALQFDLQRIDATGVWFVKPDAFRPNSHIPVTLIEEFMCDDAASGDSASQMSVNERFQLYYVVRILLPQRQEPVRFVEIGSYGGASLRLICSALQRRGCGYQGFSIEPAGTGQFHQVVASLQQHVVHLPLYSHDAVEKLEQLFSAGQLPELIFVDGDHRYEGVRQDIRDYYRLLAPGGIMLFHDWLPEPDDRNKALIYSHHDNAEPGVRRACAELLEADQRLVPLELPLLYPDDPTQTQAHLPIIPGVFSTMRAYRKPA